MKKNLSLLIIVLSINFSNAQGLKEYYDNGNGTVNMYSSSGELISTDTYLNGEKQNE